MALDPELTKPSTFLPFISRDQRERNGPLHTRAGQMGAGSSWAHCKAHTRITGRLEQEVFFPQVVLFPLVGTCGTTALRDASLTV